MGFKNTRNNSHMVGDYIGSVNIQSLHTSVSVHFSISTLHYLQVYSGR